MSGGVEGVSRLVILGSSGFIGSRVSSLLHEQLPSLPVEGISLPELDLTDPDQAARLGEHFSADTCVVMTAAVKKQLGDNLDAFDRNVSMVSSVCRVLEEHPVGRFVFFSSAAVYGEDVHNLAISEQTAVDPRTFYGIAKYTAERMLAKVVTASGGSLLLLRPPTVYGPGDTTNTYGPAGFVRSALRGETITLWGDGEELREFVHVDDLAAAVVALTFSDAEGPVNVASGVSHTFREVLDLIAAELGRDIGVDSRARSKDKVDNAFENDLLLVHAPDTRFRSLEVGVRELIAAERAVT